MISPDAREIVFAGAGILWGATTFVRGFEHWREGHPANRISQRFSLPLSLVAGFLLVVGCTAYLAWSVRDSFH